MIAILTVVQVYLVKYCCLKVGESADSSVVEGRARGSER